MKLTEETVGFRGALADWYQSAHRPLPWRTEPNLYRTVVSELMAQQTQIKTMLPYFERWMKRFPNFEALAEAPAEAVLRHWEGLGYYSRARNLHRLAQAYVALDPKPATRGEWQALPGIGPYTSAAVASIALGLPEAVVDGNVVRILARLSGDRRSFSSNGDAVKAFNTLAETVLDPENPGTHNQAMMELGATVCLKRKPLCTVCPVLEFCDGQRLGIAEDLPKIERKAAVKVEIPRAWVRRGRRLLLYRHPEDARQLAGQYELPELRLLGLATDGLDLLASRSRSITHRRIREPIYAAPIPKKIEAPLEWVLLSELEQLTLSGPHRRWVRELLDIEH